MIISTKQKKMWNEARGKNAAKHPDYLLCTFGNLEKQIRKKLLKLETGNYSGFSGRIILVCNLHSPLLQDREVESYTETYTSFRDDRYFENCFYEIYILWKSEVDSNWKIKKLE